MKNKNGFTLMELLAVLVILALIALITVPSITNSLKSYRDKLYDTQIDNIKKAAEVWGADHLLILPNDTTSEVEVVYSKDAVYPDSYKRIILTLEDLQNEGYIDKDLKNIRKKNSNGNSIEFNKQLEIIIEKNGNRIEYEVIDQEYFAYVVGDHIKVKLNDNEREFIVIADSSNRYKNVKAILADKTLRSGEVFAWCSSTDCANKLNTSGPITLNNQLNNLNWNNATSIRLLTLDEFVNVIYTLRNEPLSNINWILGTSNSYWTSTEYGNSSAYIIPETYSLPENISNNNPIEGKNLIKNNFDSISTNRVSITTEHDIRPVIEISKKYVSLKK